MCTTTEIPVLIYAVLVVQFFYINYKIMTSFIKLSLLGTLLVR